jgi:hypothetical protein
LNGLMRVAADDRVETRGLWLEVEIVEIVEHVNMEASGLDNRRERKLLGPMLRVHITAHGKHWRDGLELREYFGRADVSRVNNKLYTAQGA